MARERTGSITKRNGVLYARVSYVDEFGKRKEVTRKAVDRSDARRIIDELHARLDQHGGIAVLNDRATLADIIEHYRKEKATPAVIRDGKKIAGLKSSYNVGLMLDVLTEHFGKKKLRDLRPAHLHAFKKKRLATPTQYGTDRSVADVNRTLEAFRAVCRWCVAQGWLARSPFEYGESVINKSHEVCRDTVLNHEDEEKLLNACTGRRSHLRAIVILAIDSAMRQGEIFKLVWRHIDLIEGIIHLPGEITKTGKPRSVPITPRLRAELEAIRSRESKMPASDDLVFGITTNVKDAWKAACKEAGLTGVRFHDLRHSAITYWIAAGINPALAMKMSGHDNYRTFLRYLNPQATTLRDVAERLHDAHAVAMGKSEGENTTSEFIN